MLGVNLSESVFANIRETVDFADVRTNRRLVTSFVVFNGRMQEALTGLDTSFGARAYCRGSCGFAGGTTLSRSNVIAGLAKAARFASQKGSQGLRASWQPPSYQAGGRYKNSVRIAPRDVPLETKVHDCLEIARAFTDRLGSLRIAYKDVTETWRILNSEGCDLEIEVAFAVVEILWRHGANVVGFIADYGQGYEVVQNQDLHDGIANLTAKIKSFGNARRLPPGSHHVVLDSYASAAFFHEAVGHVMESDWDSYPLKLLGRRGSRLGTEELSVYDDPLAEGAGSYRFDHEGTRAKTIPLITRGVLTSNLRTLDSVMRGKAADSTGNARCQNARYPAICRVSNTVVEAGDWTEEELLETCKRGLRAEGMVWASVDDAGNFLIQPQMTWLLAGSDDPLPVKIAAVQGHIGKTLRQNLAIGDSPEYHASLCSRVDQRLRVGGIVPPIMVSSLRAIPV